MHGFERERLKDEHVQGALDNIALFIHHSAPPEVQEEDTPLLLLVVKGTVLRALRGKHRLPAVELIFDRLEGKARQTLEVADITKELREKSDEELNFYLEHTRWPTEDELRLLTES